MTQSIYQDELVGISHQITPLAISTHLPCIAGALSLFSLHDHTINLVNINQEIITLHRYGSGFSPMGWVLKSYHFDYLKSIIKSVMQNNRLPLLQLDNGDLIIGDTQLITSTRQYRLTFNPAYHSQIDKNSVAKLLKQMNNPTGLFGALQQNITGQRDPKLSSLCHQFSCLMSNQPADLTPFIGLGPGLTPSFDDIMVGMIAVLSSYPQLASQRSLLQKSMLTLPLASLTTKVSATFLTYALHSQFSLQILQVVTALNQHKYYHPAIKNTLNYGHTSGADLLLGIWLAIDCFVSED